MKMIFVTGCDAAFFNTLLITLQSFAETLPDQQLLVCDYGLHPQQAQYLRIRGQLLERPLGLQEGIHVTGYKAALVRYLKHSKRYQASTDLVIWIDADLTFIDIGIQDFEKVMQAMDERQCDVAACSIGSTIEDMCHIFVDPAVLAPFKAIVQTSSINTQAPYFSTGIFFCRSEKLLQHWDERTSQLEFHPLYEQNMFNVVLQEDKTPYLDLDIEMWQVQGAVLDRLALLPKPNGRASATVGDKTIKILHSTSPLPNHLWVGRAQFQVQDVQLLGLLKLIAIRPITELQLNLLASYVSTHKQALFDAGLIGLAPRAINGYEFAPILDDQRPVMTSAPAMK
ncbi:hypothetical protein ICV00_08550 [Polynucleobacter asymbioticus]|nr:hypothetical protein ICV00_08550 [Polynucleobacter asymbioticus]